MTEYFFRALPSGEVELTKIGVLGQEAVYTVDLDKPSCSCPANARGHLGPEHKHFLWAREWLGKTVFSMALGLGDTIWFFNPKTGWDSSQ